MNKFHVWVVHKHCVVVITDDLELVPDGVGLTLHTRYIERDILHPCGNIYQAVKKMADLCIRHNYRRQNLVKSLRGN